MTTIDDLVAGLQLTQADKKDARTMGLLAAGLGMLGARGVNPLQAFRQGGAQGLLGYQGALDDARKQKTQGLLARGSAFDLLNKENAYQDADLLRKQQQDFATRFGGVGAFRSRCRTRSRHFLPLNSA
jgi:hypothetical protein